MSAAPHRSDAIRRATRRGARKRRSRREAAVADRGRERRKWIGKRALPSRRGSPPAPVIPKTMISLAGLRHLGSRMSVPIAALRFS